MRKFWIICAAGVLAVGLGTAAVQAAAADTGRNCLSHCAVWEADSQCIKDCRNDNTGVCPQNCDGNHDGVCTGGQNYQDSNGDGVCDNAGICPANCDGSHDGVCTVGQNYQDSNGDGICDNAGACTGGQNQGSHHGHCGGHYGGHT